MFKTLKLIVIDIMEKKRGTAAKIAKLIRNSKRNGNIALDLT